MPRKKKSDIEQNAEVKQDMEEITVSVDDTEETEEIEETQNITETEVVEETEEAETAEEVEDTEAVEDTEEIEEVEEVEETDFSEDEELSEDVPEEMEFEEDEEAVVPDEEDTAEKVAKQVNVFLRENENPFSFSDSVKKCKKWFSLHSRTVLPVVLLLLLAVVIGVGVRLGNKGEKKQPDETKTVTASSETTAEPSESGTETQTAALEESTDEALNQLILNYYTAMANGDTDTIATLVNPATDSFLAKVRTIGEYIDSYPAINVYVKQGPTADSRIAYVHTEILMSGYNQNVPSLQTFYVCTDQAGNYYINMNEELSEQEATYIHDADLEEDVIDLNNKITAEFNDLLAEDTAFASYYAKASSQIKASVGQAVAETDASAAAPQPEETEETTGPEPETQVVKKVRATDVVNMRASDSENADKLGKAQIGDTFTLIEEKANGWSKVKNGDTEVFIKSEYLEVVEETTVEAPTQEQQPEQNQEQKPAENTADTQLGANGYVTAKTTVNIRKTASETGEKLGTVYKGTKLDYVMNQADGWCKIKYNGQTAYVKSDYVE
jgi:uncharacterized protein YgiM (DUF1202 family)